MIEPAYIRLHRDGTLAERIEAAWDIMAECRICPRNCLVDRTSDELGVCKTGSRAIVASYGAHFGEEDPLVGTQGSGTIFFTHCNLMCVFCQNWDISHEGEGKTCESKELAEIMIHLWQGGCHNINFVTPSHVVPQILEALPLAIEAGMNIPLVYNSGGYDARETIALLDGVFDIYMPDFKFWDDEFGLKYCGVPDYRERAAEAVIEMHRQVGDLVFDENGIAERGLLVRHLVLPGGQAGTEAVSRFLAREISTETYINIMGQYRPCGRAREFQEIGRPVSANEIKNAKEIARREGLMRQDERRPARFSF